MISSRMQSTQAIPRSTAPVYRKFCGSLSLLLVIHFHVPKGREINGILRNPAANAAAGSTVLSKGEAPIKSEISGDMAFDPENLGVTLATLEKLELLQKNGDMRGFVRNNAVVRCMRIIKRMQFNSITDSIIPLDADRLPFIPKKCYSCRKRVSKLDSQNDSLCAPCGDKNAAKGNDTADLNGYNALVTGGRVKLGHHVALKLLKCGARVFVTSRFPNDTSSRFQKHPEYAAFCDRLRIIRADFTWHSEILEVVDTVKNLLYGSRLHILVNNAAQSVRRPEKFYRSTLAHEFDVVRQTLPADLPGPEALTNGEIHVDSEEHFPVGGLDENGQQIDLRQKTSWNAEIHDLSLAEVTEVLGINALAPFVLVKELFPIMNKTEDTDRAASIVNVSSAEGIFSSRTKRHHVHTNMAKAALNMLTETVHSAYAKHGVFVNSVDPGFVGDMYPVPIRIPEHNCRAEHTTESAEEDGIRRQKPPLDLWDGAARILEPIFMGVRGSSNSGYFFKCYEPYDWACGKT